MRLPVVGLNRVPWRWLVGLGERLDATFIGACKMCLVRLMVLLALLAPVACAQTLQAPPLSSANNREPPSLASPAPTSEPSSGGGSAIEPLQTEIETALPPATPPALGAPQPLLVPSPEERGLPGVTAAAYAVLDASTGAVLLEHNAQERRSPASLLKIMTALVTIERGTLDAVVTVPEAVTLLRASTAMGVQPGEHVTVRDLLYGLMLPSGNDAAVALAWHVDGSEGAFVARMNARARTLGLRDTSFVNPHGLDFQSWAGGYTSAYDLAVIARAAMENETFRQIAVTRAWTARTDRNVYLLQTQNGLLGAYPGADGVKIGWTRRAGQTMVASAVRDGRRLIAVVLGSASRTEDARRLLDEGWKLAG